MKRSFAQGNNDGSEENSASESHRQNASTTLSGAFLQELILEMEPRLRLWVWEEVNKRLRLHSCSRSSDDQIAPSKSRAYQLHFDGKLASTLFTYSKVESEDGTRVKIFLHDACTKQRITSGSISSAKINVVVLDGEFNPDDREDWTELEFSNKIAHEREGKRPLLIGDLVIQLRNGVGYLGNINFTDNSSWTKSRKFRLGVKMNTTGGDSIVREGISIGFTVKDQRGESYKKHDPPFSSDEVWRLKKIAKDGPPHKRLVKNGIPLVKDLLQMYATNPSKLRMILGCGLSNNNWDKIIEHATKCVVNDNERYMYKVAESVALVFNSIFEVVGAIFDGQNYLSVDKLDVSQMEMVERYKHLAYRNKNNLVLLEDNYLVANQPMIGMNHQIGLSISPVSSQETFKFPVEQDQLEMQVNSDYATISMPILNELQNQYGDSIPESSHRMQVFNPNLGNNLLMNNFPSGFNSVEDGLAFDGSLVPPVIAANITAGYSDQFVGSSSWPGNGLHFNSNIDPVSPGLFVHVSRIGKTKARWCKIRAVIKWKIVATKKGVRISSI